MADQSALAVFPDALSAGRECLNDVLLSRDEEMDHRLNSAGNARGHVYSACAREIVVQNAVYEAGRAEGEIPNERISFTLCRSGGGAWKRIGDAQNFKAVIVPGATEIALPMVVRDFEWPKIGLSSIGVALSRFRSICARIGIADGLSVLQETRLHRDPLVEQVIAATAAHADANTLTTLFIDNVIGLIVLHLSARRGMRPRTAGLSLRQSKLVVDFMMARYSEDISIDELAMLVGLSVSEFSRRFRMATGSPPYAFLTALRMREAQTMLRNSKLTIGEIGASVGYLDNRQFARAFYRFSGHSPAKWRQVHSI